MTKYSLGTVGLRRVFEGKSEGRGGKLRGEGIGIYCKHVLARIFRVDKCRRLLTARL